MKNYSLIMPKNVIGGENSIDKLRDIISKGYKRAVIFTGQVIIETGLISIIEDILNEGNLEYKITSDIPIEPTYEEAQKVIDEFKSYNADLIIAVGGGSTIDIAKLASVLSTDEYLVKDLLDNPSLAKKQVNSIIIPTTAGTGAEATPNAIVAVPEEELKVGIVNPEMLPDYVILDARTLKTVPFSVAASTGIDTLCHAIECITSNKANPFSDTFAYRSIDLVLKNLVDACYDKENMDAKKEMLLASFYGGVAITSSGTTGVHALSYPLGGKYHIAHGVSNAILLVPVMRFNEDACQDIFANIYDYCYREENIERSTEEKSNLLLNKLEEMVKTLKIPTSLKEFNVDENDLDDLVDAAMKVTRLLVNNRKEITAEDARKIYEKIL